MLVEHSDRERQKKKLLAVKRAQQKLPSGQLQPRVWFYSGLISFSVKITAMQATRNNPAR